MTNLNLPTDWQDQPPETIQHLLSLFPAVGETMTLVGPGIYRLSDPNQYVVRSTTIRSYVCTTMESDSIVCLGVLPGEVEVQEWIKLSSMVWFTSTGELCIIRPRLMVIVTAKALSMHPMEHWLTQCGV